jgi:glutamate N-acetyltransferase/amino-acid N-acetyltransferase
MYRFIENGTVTSAEGFYAAGIHCGIKRSKKDLALIYSKLPCTGAGTFTLNKVKAAPLMVSQSLLAQSDFVHAVVINSGNANACTGEKGLEDVSTTQILAASFLGISPDHVVVSSTGVIGQYLPMDKIESGIRAIVPSLSSDAGVDAAEAIMTTDTRSKYGAVEVELSAGKVRIGAIAKGSGMIMPNMATMLCFVTTDAAVDKACLQTMLSKAVQQSFNRISVDGDTSTNDMVVLLANGASGVKVDAQSSDALLFLEALTALCKKAAQAIVIDGEGATKLITVRVEGAATEEEANWVGKAIANSPLVKTAMHGEDANWGRIICAAGYSGADLAPEKVSIYFDDEPILQKGFQIALDEARARQILSKSLVEIRVDLGAGDQTATWWTCDLSAEYVRINAAYRT